jgi:phosphoglycolate phosphatase-like HAD superfamily hydrolase
VRFNTIIWDFDGVLMNSNQVRDSGFSLVLKDFPVDEVNKLLNFHRENGGLSRYVKFRYFFENIRNQTISEDEVNDWAARFSTIMLDNLINCDFLIRETIQFIAANQNKYSHHIASGSDQTELIKICEGTNIASYFKSIHGSPTPKKKIVSDLIQEKNYDPSETILVGDSINDYDAASVNGLHFMAYNNPALERYSTHRISFSEK